MQNTRGLRAPSSYSVSNWSTAMPRTGLVEISENSPPSAARRMPRGPASRLSGSAGQLIITYDVPGIEAKGLNPIVPVVVMDEREQGNVVPSDVVTAGGDIASGAELFTANK